MEPVSCYVSFQTAVSERLAGTGIIGNGSGSAPLSGTPRNPFRPVRFEGIPDKLATAILEDFDILVGEPLNGMTATQGPADRIEFWGFEFIHAVVGRPAERIGNRHSRCCYSDEAGGSANGFSSALTPRSASRTMARCLLSRSGCGVKIFGVKGEGDVRACSPTPTPLPPTPSHPHDVHPLPSSG